VILAGGIPKYVAMKTPPGGASHAVEWTLDIEDVAKVISSKTKALVGPAF
jgi:aspartate/methionine/tyrosine aminotransferase